MAISRLKDHSAYDYTFKYKTGMVRHKALQVTQLVFSNPKFQGSVQTEVLIYGLAIPFSLSPAGMRELRARKFTVVNLKGVGLNQLMHLDKYMDNMLEQKPKVNI